MSDSASDYFFNKPSAQDFSGQLTFFFALFAAISFIVLVLWVVRIVRRWKVEEAILNIDKNVQRLVDNTIKEDNKDKEL